MKGYGKQPASCQVMGSAAARICCMHSVSALMLVLLIAKLSVLDSFRMWDVGQSVRS